MVMTERRGNREATLRAGTASKSWQEKHCGMELGVPVQDTMKLPLRDAVQQ